MKKHIIFILVGALLLSLSGCVIFDQSGDTPTTLPTESTAPQTDATEPSDATGNDTDSRSLGVALSPETLAECQFEQWRGNEGDWYYYGYVGEKRTVTMPGGRLTITFPEGWLEDLAIIWNQQDENYYWSADISSEALLREWIAHQEDIASEDVTHNLLAQYAYMGYVIRILGIPNDVTNIAYVPEGYLGKDENYTYVFVIPDFWEDWWDMWRYREDMMDALGEDTYNTLLNGMVITEEMAREMITITNLVEDGE